MSRKSNGWIHVFNLVFIRLLTKIRKRKTAYRPIENGTPLPPGKQPAMSPEPTPKAPADERHLTNRLKVFLEEHYEFRFNRMNEVTEYRRKGNAGESFFPVGQRELNSLCLEAHDEEILCWDRDVVRYIHSLRVAAYHPFHLYVSSLPAWDGTDRIEALARRVSDRAVWVNGFRRWMLGMVAQWTGRDSLHANSVAPVLVSRRQGMQKSTFCKLLLPDTLQAYYTDSFDITAVSAAEQKLTAFGLINLDEIDKFSPRKMAQLKNLMQMAGLNIRKAYQKSFALLPRIASFIATSNEMGLLTDHTGSRRFLCVEVERPIDCSPIDHTQVYAQLRDKLTSGERYWFTPEEETEIMAANTPFQRFGMEADVFHACYRRPLNGEKPELLSSAHIFAHLQRKNPTAMRGVHPQHFGRVLIGLGVERIHTKMGNKYRVMPNDQ